MAARKQGFMAKQRASLKAQKADKTPRPKLSKAARKTANAKATKTMAKLYKNRPKAVKAAEGAAKGRIAKSMATGKNAPDRTARGARLASGSRGH